MSIKKSIFKIFNGSSWDEYYHKTSADQVVYTKPDGTASNVQAELAKQNSAMIREITEINYQYYTSATEVSNIDMNFKIGNIVHLQCEIKRNDGGKYPVSTGLIHIQNGSHRPKNNLIIPAYIRVGNEWHPHYVYVRTNGEIHQDFSNNTEEILINGCYPTI